MKLQVVKANESYEVTYYSDGFSIYFPVNEALYLETMLEFLMETLADGSDDHMTSVVLGAMVKARNKNEIN